MTDVQHRTKPISQSIDDLLSVKELQSKLDSNKTLLIICFVTAFAAFDFSIFTFLSDILSISFFEESTNRMMQTLKLIGLFAAGFVARPVGAFILGRYGDKRGRKPALHIGLTLLFVTSIIGACLPTYAQVGVIASVLLITVRLIQGGAFANQVVMGWVYISESVPKKRLAIYISLVCASLVFGSLVCAVFIAFLNHIFSAAEMVAYAWRIPFVVSAIIGLLGYYLVRRLNESSLYLVDNNNDIIDTDLESASSSIHFTRTHTLLLTAFMSLMFASVMVLIAVLLPRLIASQIVIEATVLNTVKITGIVCLTIGMAFYGWVANKLGTGRALIIGAALLCMQTVIFQYVLLNSYGSYLVPTYALLGFSCGFVSLCPSIFVHLFPTRNRLTSISVIFNSVGVFTGIILPISLVFIVQYISVAPALYLIFIALSALFVSYYTYQIPQLYEFKTDKLRN